MPTFHSIPLHPVVQERFLNADVPIVTPLALLARPPEALHQALLVGGGTPASTTTTMRMMDLEHIHRLRRQVAVALVAGGRSRRRRRGTGEGDGDGEDDGTRPNLNIPWRELPSVSVWDQLQATTTTSTIAPTASSRQLPLSTRCPPLDAMLAFPVEWRDTNDVEEPSPSRRQGTPPGHVLSIAGGPGVGKTQLALQMAVHMAYQYQHHNQQQQHQPPLTVRYFATSAGGASLLELATRAHSLLPSIVDNFLHDGNEDDNVRQCSSSKRHKQDHCSATTSNNITQTVVPSNLLFSPIHNVQDLIVALGPLIAEHEQQDKEQRPQEQVHRPPTTTTTGMIVIDSLDTLPDGSSSVSVPGSSSASSWTTGSSNHHPQQQPQQQQSSSSLSSSSSLQQQLMATLKHITRRYQLHTVIILGGSCSRSRNGGESGRRTMVGSGSTMTTTGSGTSSGPLHQPSFAGEETIDVQLLLEREEPSSSSSSSPPQVLLVNGRHHENTDHRRHRHIITARCIHHHHDHPIRTHNNNNNGSSDGGIVVSLELSPEHGITAASASPSG